ncbi:MAG: hypothetical protein HQL49_04475 [Gammaproteobacteria bacterium]|nr:hypothetical protein [Gammaproteobacteria bacterium]
MTPFTPQLRSVTRMVISGFLLFLSLSPITYAKDMDGRHAVYAVGGESCTPYMQARRQGGEIMERYNHFILGYLTAFNLIVENTHNILGDKGYAKALAWLDGFCQINPKENFTTAIATMTEIFYSERANFADDPNRPFFSNSTADNIMGRKMPPPNQ